MKVNKDRQQKYISLFLESKSPKLSAKDIRRYTKHIWEGLQFFQEYIETCEAAGMHYDMYTALQSFEAHLRVYKKEPRGRVKYKVDIMHEFFDFRITGEGGEAMKQEDMPSQSVSVGTDSDAEPTPSKQIKITIYPDKALKKDIEDLADVYGLPVSKFILKVIQQEVNNRKEDLNVIRSIRAKRG